MGAEFATEKRALGECDRCGFTYDLKKLKKETVNEVIVNLRICPTCFEPDHPQLLVGKYPVRDPQALKEPRSDQATHAQSRELLEADGLTTLVGSVEDYLEANL